MTLSPHPFTLRQLQYVVAVADYLSFRKAADACAVSQPALSAQIAQVEDLLGVVLFERDRRRVLPSPAGVAIVEAMRELLAGADALLAAARRAQDPLKSTLRFGVIPTIAPYLLPHFAGALRQSFPELFSFWVEEKTPVLIERLMQGQIDAAVLALEADLGEVEYETICRDPFVLATPAEHTLAKGKGAVTPAALAGESILLLEEGHCFRTQALDYCARTGAAELAYRATSLGTLTQMVAGGAGITLLPAMSVDTEKVRADVAIRELTKPVPFRTVVLAWRRKSPLADALRTIAGVMQTAAVQ